MAVYTIDLHGIELDVYADVTFEKDPYGTGDSPESVSVDINEVELAGSAVNILDLLSDNVVEHIGRLVVKEERNE